MSLLGQYSQLLNAIGLALDISETQYNLVEARYQAVADHLSKEASALKALALVGVLHQQASRKANKQGKYRQLEKM